MSNYSPSRISKMLIKRCDGGLCIGIQEKRMITKHEVESMTPDVKGECKVAVGSHSYTVNYFHFILVFLKCNGYAICNNAPKKLRLKLLSDMS